MSVNGSTQVETGSNEGMIEEGSSSIPPPRFLNRGPKNGRARYSYPPSVVSANLSRSIDFFSPDYYDQMLSIRKEVAERPSVVPSLIHHLLVS